MNIFRNKFLVKLIASICIFLTLINMGVPNRAYAAEDDPVWGGILITPVTKLLTALADGIMAILHKAVLEERVSLITVSGNPSWWDKVGSKVVGILIGAVAVVVCAVILICSYGTAAPAAFGIAAMAVGAVEVISSAVVSLVVNEYHPGLVGSAGTVIAKKIGNWVFDRDIYLPAFQLAPDRIFANQIPMFDINFFNPNNQVITETETETETIYPEKDFEKLGEAGNISSQPDNANDLKQMVNSIPQLENIIERSNDVLKQYGKTQIDYAYEGFMDWKIYKSVNIYGYDIDGRYSEYGWNLPEFGVDLQTYPNGYKREESTVYIQKLDDTAFYTLEYTCTQNYWHEQPSNGEHTEKVELATYDRRFYSIIHLKTEKVETKTEQKAETKEIQSTAGQLQGVVSQWYFILRNLALLVLMLLLIYTGIRIVIGSTAGEKAKHKERLIDWLVAVCLIFIMHYIMVFALQLNEKIIKLVENVTKLDVVINAIELGEYQIKNINKMEDAAEEGNASGVVTEQYEKFKEIAIIDANNYLYWTTDLTGSFRVEAQKINEGTAKWVGYSFCYLVLVLQTLFFSWAYIKRVLYMAFLTVIAPLVAMTYPIDKLTDGKAQAFEAWLKEYIFNLLIQPMHLLLYGILISSAFSLAATNAIYAVVAIGFMMPAEKLLRRFFGFEKAKTPGMLGGAAGAALAFSGLQKMMNLGQRGGKKRSGNKEKSENTKIRMKGSNENNPFKAIGGAKSKGKSSGSSEGWDKGRTIGDVIDTKTTEVKGLGPDAALPGAKDSNPNKGLPRVVPASNSPDIKAAKPKEKSTTKPMGKKKSFIRRATTTGTNMGKAYFRMLGQKAKRSIKKGKPIRALARGATGALGATAFGMAGLALGVAGGDPSKAVQYTSAGLIGGYQAGKGVAGSVVDTFSVDKEKLKDEAEMSYYGPEYKQHMLDKSKEDLVKDEKSIDYLRKLTGVDREEAQEILRTTGGACLDAGITDIGDIATIHEMTNGKDAVSMEEAMAAQQFNQYLPSELNKMGEDDRNQHILRWAREFERQGYENSTGLAEESMKLAERFNKTKSGMKKVKT